MSVTLTIVMPAYNAATTIRAALDSIVTQTFRDYEVLVMDGGSKDDTATIVKDIAQSNPQIKFFSERDNGIYDAMNKGIVKAQGEWIYFLGADDLLADNNVLQKIFSSAENRSFDVIYGQVLLMDSNKLYLGEFDAEKLVFRNISHQAIFTKKSVFDKLGLYDLKYRICADHIFNVKWFFDNAIRKKFVDVVVAKFGQQGISSQKDDMDKVRDLPRYVRTYGGSFLYFRFYYLRPVIQWFRKKSRAAKKKAAGALGR